MTMARRKTTTPKPQAPNVTDSERTLAGSLLLQPERVLKVARAAGINADTFSDESAKRVFGAVGRLIDAGRLAEPLEVQREAGLDVAVIQKLIDDCPTAAHAEYHVGIVRAAAIKRDALREIGAADGETAIRMACERITARLPTAQTGVQAVDAAGWLAEPDEPESPIMQGLFDHGDRVALVGQSKARKSFYALQLAVAVAIGKPFLGFETVKQRVVVVNGEIRAGAYKRRLRRMIARLGIGAADLAGLVVVNAAESGEPDSFNAVLTLAKKHHAAVCVVDPAYLLIGDEINQGEVKDAVRAMKAFAAAGVTLVTVFHATKGKMGDKQTIDRISGSGIFARDCSTLISLCEHASEPDHVVVSAVTRNFPPSEPNTIRFEEGAFVSACDVAAIEKTSTTKPRRSYAVDQIRDCFSETPMTYGDTVKAVQDGLGCGRDRAKEEIGRAVRDGLAITEQRGRQTLYAIRSNAD